MALAVPEKGMEEVNSVEPCIKFDLVIKLEKRRIQ